MTEHEIKILGAFDAAMQTFVDAWHGKTVPRDTVLLALGGAMALRTLMDVAGIDAPAAKKQADMLFKQAEQLLEVQKP